MERELEASIAKRLEGSAMSEMIAATREGITYAETNDVVEDVVAIMQSALPLPTRR